MPKKEYTISPIVPELWRLISNPKKKDPVMFTTIVEYGKRDFDKRIIWFPNINLAAAPNAPPNPIIHIIVLLSPLLLPDLQD